MRFRRLLSVTNFLLIACFAVRLLVYPPILLYSAYDLGFVCDPGASVLVDHEFDRR